MSKYLNKDLKELLLQYNITDQDIKGSGKRGAVLKSDREREYLKLQTLDMKEVVIIDDLLYQILLQTDINDMENVCLINKNTIKICHNVHFWIDKLNKDHINYDLPLPTNLNDIIQYYKIKKAIPITQSIINTYHRKYHIYIEFDNFDIQQLCDLFKKPLNLLVDCKVFKKVIIMFMIWKGEWRLMFTGIYKDKRKKNYNDGLQNLSNDELVQYLAKIIGNFPNIGIYTDFHKLVSWYDLIKA